MENTLHIIEVFGEPSLGLRGNTAAVLWNDSPLSEGEMQTIASDLLQPATTFISPADTPGHYKVRWFAPDAEIGLCGHGSLAAMAFLHHLKGENEATLLYGDGKIQAQVRESQYALIMDSIPIKDKMETPQAIRDGLGIEILEHFSTFNKDIIVVKDEDSLRQMQVNFARLRDSDIFGYAVTAPSTQYDFVSRTLVPHVRQLEDPATGSSHAALFPFWAERLGKKKMKALQLSSRGGYFSGELSSDQSVILTGNARILLQGKWQ